jgi:hypothetical protein
MRKILFQRDKGARVFPRSNVRKKGWLKQLNFFDIHEILQAKWQGGEGDVFSQEKRICCFSYIQNFVQKLLHCIIEL